MVQTLRIAEKNGVRPSTIEEKNVIQTSIIEEKKNNFVIIDKQKC